MSETRLRLRLQRHSDEGKQDPVLRVERRIPAMLTS
jgi:hypothetical protein